MKRSKTAWYEEGEKNSNFFLNLEKRNKSKSTIHQICLKNEEITQDQKVIQQEIRTFYKDLYTSSETIDESCLNSFISEFETPKISNLNKDKREGAITMEERKKVLPTFQRNKSPDGLPMEFYVVFSNQILDILVESLNPFQWVNFQPLKNKVLSR